MHKCLNPKCNVMTNNPKFCSKSCAAIYNNIKFPKRTRKKYYCRVCGIELPPRRVLCDDHNPQVVDWSKVTLSDVIYNYNSGHGPSNKYTRIRDHAKVVHKNSGRPEQCEKCGYKPHYHICHIKPIHMFDLEVVVSEINNLDNLIALCPNCHWEMDNGIFAPTRDRT